MIRADSADAGRRAGTAIPIGALGRVSRCAIPGTSRAAACSAHGGPLRYNVWRGGAAGWPGSPWDRAEGGHRRRGIGCYVRRCRQVCWTRWRRDLLGVHADLKILGFGSARAGLRGVWLTDRAAADSLASVDRSGVVFGVGVLPVAPGRRGLGARVGHRRRGGSGTVSGGPVQQVAPGCRSVRCSGGAGAWRAPGWGWLSRSRAVAGSVPCWTSVPVHGGRRGRQVCWGWQGPSSTSQVARPITGFGSVFGGPVWDARCVPGWISGSRHAVRLEMAAGFCLLAKSWT